MSSVTRFDLAADMPRLEGAACVDYPADWWFTDEAKGRNRDGTGTETTGSKRQRLATMRTAIAICQGCPVLAACDTYCQENPKETKFGIWAGKTARQRGYDHRGQKRRRTR